MDLVVGPEAVLDAADVVSDFNPLTTPVHLIKRAIATLIVAFMEAQRFPFIRQIVSGYWAWLAGMKARSARVEPSWW